MSFFASFARALAAALAKLYGWASATLAEAAEPVTRHWPAVRRGLGYAPSYAAIGAGAVIGAPGAVLRSVGGALGGLLPSPAVTPEAVASVAAAQDRASSPRQSARLQAGYVGAAVRDVAQAILDGDMAAASRAPELTPAIVAWIGRLSTAEVRALAQLSPARIEGHVYGRSPSELLAPMPVAVTAETATPRYTAAEMRAMVRQAQAGLRREDEAVREQRYGATPRCEADGQAGPGRAFAR
jgi:hypothetical protein